MIVGMSAEAARDPERALQDRTLGDVLYSRGTLGSMSEEAWFNLVKSIASGDQVALAWLYEHTHRLVFTLAARITNSIETAEELTLDVFHDVWRKASNYDPANGSVIGWIMNQTRSRAIDRVRYEQRKKRTGDKTESDGVALGTIEDPQFVFEIKEQSHHLRQALNRLNPVERQAIEMAFFLELTYPEVASRLNEPLGTIKSRIRSGLGKLRRALSKEPGD